MSIRRHTYKGGFVSGDVFKARASIMAAHLLSESVSSAEGGSCKNSSLTKFLG